MKYNAMRIFAVLVLAVAAYNFSYAHCDTEDGPVIKDARIALEKNNVNYVLKWIPEENEKELIEAFNLAQRERSAEPGRLAEKRFFEMLVRIHRNGEGVEFDGVKPAGTPIDVKILAADRSIEEGNLKPLGAYVPKNKRAELKKRFDRVIKLKNFDVNNVAAGRRYVEAYVQFFHFAEGEVEESHNNHNVGGCGHK